MAEREAFSYADSDEEDSEYEEVVVSKVKKRNWDLEADKSKAKSTKLNPKTQTPKTYVDHN